MNKTETPKLLKNRLMIENRAFVFPSPHTFFEVFDRKLQNYIEAGLMNYNVKAWKQQQKLKMLQKVKEPFAVLTLDQLEAAFVVSLAPTFLSFLAFSIEWLVTIKDLIIFLVIFKIYFKTKEFERKCSSAWVKIKMIEARALNDAKEKCSTVIVEFEINSEAFSDVSN